MRQIQSFNQILIGLALAASTSLASAAMFSNENDALESQNFNTSDTENYKAKSSLKLSIDRDFSAFTGADLNHALYRSYMWLDDTWIPSSQGNTAYYAIGGRVLKTLLESRLSYFLMIHQHEVFGHGARAREFNLPISNYSVGFNSGSVSFSGAKYLALHPHERMQFNLGGVEANTVLGNRIRNEFLEQQSMDVRESLMYLHAWYDQTRYVMSTRYERNLFSSGHDIQAYVSELNNWHEKQVMTGSKLRKRSSIDILDPFLFFGTYNIVKYLWNGEQGFQYPSLEFAGYSYLPTFRNQLTPYGTEIQFLNYLRTPNSNVIQAYFKYGKTGEKKSWGMGAEARELVSLEKMEALKLGAKMDIWHQPRLLGAAQNTAGTKNKFGLSTSVLGSYNITNDFDLNAELGFKTKGYVLAETLKASALMRVGFTFRP
ncbi:MAG: hypothetical protein ACKOAD_04645 [Gammaproteobacteria bacterium]